MRSWAPILAAVCALAGCSSARTTSEMLGSVKAGDYPGADKKIDETYGDSSRNRLVVAMERGMVSHLAGDLAGSNTQFGLAAPLVDERRKLGLGDAVGMALLNDNAADYAGRAFEHLQVDYYRVLNHLLAAQIAEGLWQPPALCWPQGGALRPPAAVGGAASHYESANVLARRLVQNQLREAQDAAGGKRYDDDPFCRVLAAAVVGASPRELIIEQDQQEASIRLRLAREVYRRQHALLASGNPFRYEVAERPVLVETLYWRQLASYDPGRMREELEQARLAQPPLLKEGEGSALVLLHVGFITRPEELQIGIIAAGVPPPEPSAAERARGIRSKGFGLGGIGFYAMGPGVEVVDSWAAIPFPGELVQRILAPGGATWVGFELPVHRSDRPIDALARLSVDGGPECPLEVVHDLDAYARATLKDEQPMVLLRTLTRMVAKQTAVFLASKQAREEHGGGAGLLVNVLGSVAMSATEQADVRAWTTLPDHVEAALVDLPAGSHRLALTGPAGTMSLGEVVIRPGRITLVAARAFTPNTGPITEDTP